jgi:hypothetical protein
MVTVRELHQAAAQAALKEQRRRALNLPLTATDGEREVVELAAAAAAAQVELEMAAARGERTFTVDGAAVGFEVAEFGPTAGWCAGVVNISITRLLLSFLYLS